MNPINFCSLLQSFVPRLATHPPFWGSDAPVPCLPKTRNAELSTQLLDPPCADADTAYPTLGGSSTEDAVLNKPIPTTDSASNLSIREIGTAKSARSRISQQSKLMQIFAEKNATIEPSHCDIPSPCVNPQWEADLAQYKAQSTAGHARNCDPRKRTFSPHPTE